VTTDLFGQETAPELFGKGGRRGPKGGKHYVQPRGYGGRPGSGPKDETCGTCAHAVRFRQGKSWIKCELARAKWTGGRATDILARAAACDKWKPEEIPTK
jgi:hypothetical protein